MQNFENLYKKNFDLISKLNSFLYEYEQKKKNFQEIINILQKIHLKNSNEFRIIMKKFNIFYFERLKLGNIIYILYCQYLPKELVQNIRILLLISSNFV